MSKLTNLDEMFFHDLGDIYDAEHRFLDAQKAMRPLAADRKLQQMIDRHIKQTEQQIVRLEKAYVTLGKPAKRVKCAAAAGLVSEGQKGMEDSEENAQIRDCMIVVSSTKVEHYEICSYRGLIAAAEVLQKTELIAIFEENLAEEIETAELVEQSLPAFLTKAKAGALTSGRSASPKKKASPKG